MGAEFIGGHGHGSLVEWTDLRIGTMNPVHAATVVRRCRRRGIAATDVANKTVHVAFFLCPSETPV